jgi:5-methylcytosine-specific restriction endonuclease McrA
MKRALKTCRYCGEVGTKQVCKKHECKKAANRDVRRKGRVPEERACEICHKVFMPRMLHRRRACDACHSAHPFRRAEHEHVNRRKVFERDNWTCQHCGVHTPPTLRGTIQPDAPELDHILPRGWGGAHSYFNAQLLCRNCNELKGDDVAKEPKLAGMFPSEWVPYKWAKHSPAKPWQPKKPAFTLIDLTGKTYGHLTITGYAGKQRWNWKCACGALGQSHKEDLKSGKKLGCAGQCCRILGHIRYGFHTVNTSLKAA